MIFYTFEKINLNFLIMKKIILGIACAATMVFGTFLSLTEAKAQQHLEKEGENTRIVDYNYPDDPCTIEYPWDCTP